VRSRCWTISFVSFSGEMKLLDIVEILMLRCSSIRELGCWEVFWVERSFSWMSYRRQGGDE